MSQGQKAKKTSAENVGSGQNIKGEGINIGVRSFVIAIGIIFILMVATYILTLVVPGGEYARVQDAAGNTIKVVQSSSTLKGIYFVIALCGAIGNLLPAITYSLDRFTGKRRDEILLELDEMRKKRNALEGTQTTELVGESS